MDNRTLTVLAEALTQTLETLLTAHDKGIDMVDEVGLVRRITFQARELLDNHAQCDASPSHLR